MLIPCRALLDSGSQVHFVTSRLAQQLQLQKKYSEVSVSGLGGSCAISEGCCVDIQLESHASNYAATNTALIASTITGNQPNGILNINRWNMPSNIPLADQKFYQPQPVDILIGAALFFELPCAGNIKLETGLPRLQETRLLDDLKWPLARPRMGSDIKSGVAVLKTFPGATIEQQCCQRRMLKTRALQRWEYVWLSAGPWQHKEQLSICNIT
ncbi:uncharacterized protein LOC111073217 [Drosophila obscura]|uniref:uncharacterized protein LOC111073217 n=1 Tax=Drosophila obscura TaxID=7282 RepID=UPI000BA0386F|nr:uncharacterized protein LOC111073217 [Drosophila obscura]